MTASNIRHVKMVQHAQMELTTTIVPVYPAGQGGTAKLTLMSVSLDSVKIMQHVLRIILSITTPVTAYLASQTSTVLQILMNVNLTRVKIMEAVKIALMDSTAPANLDLQVTYLYILISNTKIQLLWGLRE